MNIFTRFPFRRGLMEMLRFKLQISVLTGLMLCLYSSGQPRKKTGDKLPVTGYQLVVTSADSAPSFIDSLGIRSVFADSVECARYIMGLPALLRVKGYINASVDSIFYQPGRVQVVLYAGEKYQWASLGTASIDPAILQAVNWKEQQFADRPMNFTAVEEAQEKILAYLENNGHPFAKLWLDSLQIRGDRVWAQLKLEEGPLYKIDSLRIFGNVNVSNLFLQRYLGIGNGSIFNKEKFLLIGKKIRDLSYLEEEKPASLVWLGSGAVVELYLKPRKSSQVNVLVGFLPNNDQLSSRKLLVTGEANLNLQNMLGAGETIGLNWQQLQVRSPRLDITYRHPYIFKTTAGLDFAFNMFRKDSTFLNVNFQVGARYLLQANRSVTLFLQRFQTIVNGVDTTLILQQYRLPDAADLGVVNAGVNYEVNTTDYRLNPSKGSELRIIVTAGTKKIRRNNEVLELKDPGNPSFDFGSLYDTLRLKTYQFRVRASVARYFPLGRSGRNVIKAALHAGFLQSGNLFRNELFQIGGYKLLRGFDEESQYLSQFGVVTAEYRYRVGPGSYFYGFADGGWGRNNSRNANVQYTYFGTGLGLAFETGAGIFDLAWAVGKRSDLELNLRQSKIHIGFVSYF